MLHKTTTGKHYVSRSTVNSVMALLRRGVPMDKTPVAENRYSYNGIPNVRFQCITHGVRYRIDVYSSRYICCHLPNEVNEVFKSTMDLIYYLRNKLILKGESQYE